MYLEVLFSLRLRLYYTIIVYDLKVSITKIEYKYFRTISNRYEDKYQVIELRNYHNYLDYII